MPLNLQFYINYIHNEFIEKDFDWEGLRIEGKYDKLFELFFYLSEKPDSIAVWYPLTRKGKKSSNIKKRGIKDNSTHSVKKKSKSRNSSQSSNANKSRDKIKDNIGKKKVSRETNIYLDLLGTGSQQLKHHG